MTKFQEYAAQQAQNEPPTHEVQYTAVDALADRLDAERYRDLLTTARGLLDKRTPPALLLEAIIKAMYGDHSPEADALGEIIGSDGLELALTAFEEQKRRYKSLLRLLDAQTQRARDGLDAIADAEIDYKFSAASANFALDDLTALNGQLRTEGLSPAALSNAWSVFWARMDSGPALDLLYTMLEQAERKGPADPGALQSLDELKRRIMAELPLT